MLARLGIGARLALASAILLLIAGFTIEALSSRQLEASMIERVRGELALELSWLESTIEGDSRARSLVAWDAIADDFGKQARARVTLIAANGDVIGDSEVATDELGRLENHAHREEVALALQRGEGTAIRLSPTLHVRMIYAARRYERAGQAPYVLRLAVPLTDVDKAIASSRRLLAIETAFAIALAAAVAAFSTHRLTRPLRQLTGVARSMSEGNLDARADRGGADEVSVLGNSLNDLASKLSRTFSHLSHERDLLAGILDGMGEGVLVLDQSKRIVLANPALRAMALLAADPVGKEVIEAIRNTVLQEAIERALTSEEPVVSEIELSGILPKRVIVRVSCLSSAPAPSGILAVFHDVTDLRRLETMRTDFVANVSHELRTPVTAIATATETLLSGAANDRDDTLEFARMIERQARRLRQLVDDLLDLSKMESKGFRLKNAQLDVASVVEHVLRLMAEPAKRRAVTLVFEGARDVRAIADRRALEQVLSNLLDNAIKYAGERAHVTLSIRPQGEHAVIVVKDDGPGIPAAHLQRIFERFYRVDPGRSRDVGGTGLGLSIVKHLVELMNGSITVESTLGQGATFTIRLPRPPAA